VYGVTDPFVQEDLAAEEEGMGALMRVGLISDRRQHPRNGIVNMRVQNSTAEILIQSGQHGITTSFEAQRLWRPDLLKFLRDIG
jgi:hypothetical protein